MLYNSISRYYFYTQAAWPLFCPPTSTTINHPPTAHCTRRTLSAPAVVVPISYCSFCFCCLPAAGQKKKLHRILVGGKLTPSVGGGWEEEEGGGGNKFDSHCSTAEEEELVGRVFLRCSPWTLSRGDLDHWTFSI